MPAIALSEIAKDPFHAADSGLRGMVKTMQQTQKSKPLATGLRDAILVVDDTPLMIELIRKTLEDSGYTIFEALNGEQAEQIFAANPSIKVVLCDINLGDGANGFEVLAALMPHRSHRFFKFCFITGQNDDNIKATALRYGADELLKKPVNPRTLRDTVSRLLGESSDETVQYDRIRIRIDQTHADLVDSPIRPHIQIRELTKYTMLLEVSGKISDGYCFKIFSPKLARTIESDSPFFTLKVTNSILISAAMRKAESESKAFRYTDGNPNNYLIRCHILDLTSTATNGIEALHRRLTEQQRERKQV